MNRAAIVLASAALVAAVHGQMPPTIVKHVGKPLPAFSATSTTGQKVTNASLRGHVVLLDFWATWCGPCKAASPAIQKLHANYGGKGLKVIGADTFEQGAKNTAGPYAKRHGYTYTFTEGNDALATALGATSIPAFVLVDAKGVVRKVWTGLPEGGPDALYKEIEAAAKPLLKA